jgi:RNA polymerase sigma-70 factor (ECF subfamily)
MILALFIRSSSNRNTQGREATDEELVALYREEKDPETVGILFNRYTHLVFGACMMYLKNEEDARDAVMEIFEGLLNSLLIHTVKNFKSWLYSVAKNHCLMKLRSISKEHSLMDDLKTNNNAAVMEMMHEMHLDIEDHEMMEKRLMEAISGLGEEQHTCIRLMYLEEKSYADISGITGYSLKQVKSHIQNGKRNLKIALQSTDEN